MVIDFADKELTYKRLHGGGNGMPVAKACGVKGSFKPRVIDATAGLAKDAFLLASLGCEVVLIERNETVHAALVDGLIRASLDPEISDIVGRMTLLQGDANVVLPTLEPADVVYLDPMFEPRKKTALVKQAMRDLKEVVGEDVGNDNLLSHALEKGKRIVVKRAKGAPFYGGIETKDQIVGKSNRFDIYAGRCVALD